MTDVLDGMSRAAVGEDRIVLGGLEGTSGTPGACDRHHDFVSQLIYLTKPELQTAPVALRNYVDATSGASWGSLFAMSVVTLIPVFIVFLVGQRYLVKGIATTGMK
ncbi:hypothetical protein AB0E85_35040 [Streptomyces sp. NPDC029044]|uniref:hypothetical protein n=1 Tax=Streptomyces sp. NPDC029044 TaxID=3157198 RepID=UPI0033E36839